ncbi:SAM-dependent methyltransferase [Aestuariivita sp.]|jgi:SAM-dependent MidA family methyltransferase|uniref:class I SAM-dependent methyltransferase n=1 Tax=Aestuariivita sp. TaxID=1872407 RepID=UPI00216F854E|nr:SAM-dependent methyltransferase [Aestuariivita sp.]MCE8007751.1 class I SAM-dependent methyltransferase [Aestuariivita sp.]
MSLLDLLVARITAQGPITVAEYMADCLLHPAFGYYATRDPLGAEGDFITAPEISQIFGELLGLGLAQSWVAQGRPQRIILAEAGPGRGTLMADALRAARAVPGFVEAAQLVLLEASPTLRTPQADMLGGYAPHWIESLGDLPDDAPLFFIANEFFDALPIRQFQRDGRMWRERQVGVAGDALRFGLGPAQPQPALAHRLDDTTDGDLIEHCSALAPAIDAIGQRIAVHGGAALIVDYGDWRSLGDTLQALRDHKPVDPLKTPGAADLTAHVDFEAIAQAAPCAHTRLTTQGVFLERLGITHRARSLAQHLTGNPLDNLIAAHRRLTHPEEMGNLFKVIGLFPEGQAPPPGLDI